PALLHRRPAVLSVLHVRRRHTRSVSEGGAAVAGRVSGFALDRAPLPVVATAPPEQTTANRLLHATDVSAGLGQRPGARSEAVRGGAPSRMHLSDDARRALARRSRSACRGSNRQHRRRAAGRRGTGARRPGTHAVRQYPVLSLARAPGADPVRAV